VDRLGGPGTRSLAYVDTGPILERGLAGRAGLGFVGKNTNLIHPRLGSWLFLGTLLLDIDLVPDSSSGQGFRAKLKDELDQRPRPTESGEGLPAVPGDERGQRPRPRVVGTCGSCTRCLDACPTGALVAPYILDARRCISYLTIELKGSIPPELRPQIGNRIFGCDICQEVCPWNHRFAQATSGVGFQPRHESVAPLLLDLIALDDEAFRQRFRGSPVMRAKRRGLLRNVAVALGNWGDPAAVQALSCALYDSEPLIREHAAWALRHIGTPKAQQCLGQAAGAE
jgi:epoxyqueuosine reductase